MKSKLNGKKSNGPGQFETIAAIAVACGFWVSQFLAWDIVSSSLGVLPKITGVLSFGAFVTFFIIRARGSWSRLPAILGLGALSVMIALVAYLGFGSPIRFIELFILLSLALSVAGLGLDVKRCWHLIAGTNLHLSKAGTFPNLSLRPLHDN